MDFQKENVEKIFGTCHNKNGYRYTWFEDEKIIGEIEGLCMIWTKVLHTRMINKMKARGFVCQKKGKDANWVVFVEWTIWDQLWKIQCLEAIRLGKSVCIHGILSDNDNGFLKIEDKEMGTKINTMLFPSNHGHHFQKQVEAFND
jgi:hypothetical protein